MVRLVRALAFVSLLVPVLCFSTPAQARPVIGGQLFSTGGDLEFFITPARPGLQPVQFFVNVGGERRFIATGDYTGKTVTLSDLPAGEAIFEMVVQDGPVFKTGPATRNPDNDYHATVEFYGGDDPEYAVNFEETLEPSNPDYDDQGFAVWGRITGTPPIVEGVEVSPETVPQPGGKVDVAIELVEGTAPSSVTASFRLGIAETNVPLSPTQGDPDAFTGSYTLPANTSGDDLTWDVVFLITVGGEEPVAADGGSITQFASTGGRWTIYKGLGRPQSNRKPIVFKTVKIGNSSDRDFLVINDGDEVLEAQIKVTGTGFSIAAFSGDELPTGTTQITVRIPPLGTRGLSLRFRPLSGKKHKGTLDVTSTDVKRPHVVYKLQGSGKRGR